MLNIIEVRDYGAVPDDGRADTVAVREALEACRDVANPVLRFGSGTYDFRRDPPSGHDTVMLPVENIDNLTIDGGGALLRYDGLVHPFIARNCNNLTFRNFTVDWKRPPFSVGDVVAVEDTSFDVRVRPEFPVEGGERVDAYMEYDLEAGHPLPSGVERYHDIGEAELVAPQVLRISLSNQPLVKAGNGIILRHQVYVYNTIQVENCNNVLVQDVTIHTCPGMAFYGHESADITLERLRVEPPPGSNRIMSTTADATHFFACQGTVTLRDCYFDGMGDDGCNVKGLYLTTEEREDDVTVLAQHNLDIPAAPDVGDVLEFSKPADLIPYATTTVASVVKDAGGGKHRIRLSEPLPANFDVGDLLANVTRMPKLRVDNLTVRNNRARGILIQTRDAIVENSTFENCSHAGALVLTESVYFFESAGTRDVVLRNNTFLNCGYFQQHGHSATLAIFAWLKDFQMPPRPGLHRNILVEGNTIKDSMNSAIFVAGADGVVIRNNIIEGACCHPTHDTGNKAVYIMNSADVRLTGNDLDPEKQGASCEETVFLGPGNTGVVIEDE